jgi:hypothetical protein
MKYNCREWRESDHGVVVTGDVWWRVEFAVVCRGSKAVMAAKQKDKNKIKTK